MIPLCACVTKDSQVCGTVQVWERRVLQSATGQPAGREDTGIRTAINK